jgi:hypothetical protein
MDGNNRRDASPFSVGLSIRPIAHQRPSGVAIENVALRMQIAAFQRKRKRPLLTTLDRVFWITLRSVWSDWQHPLIYVQADAVVRWQARTVPEVLGRLSKPQRRRRGRSIRHVLPSPAAPPRNVVAAGLIHTRSSVQNPPWLLFPPPIGPDRHPRFRSRASPSAAAAATLHIATSGSRGCCSLDKLTTDVHTESPCARGDAV